MCVPYLVMVVCCSKRKAGACAVMVQANGGVCTDLDFQIQQASLHQSYAKV